MLVNIDNDTALEMLLNRLRFWTDDDDVIALYKEMYENYIDCGCFDGREFDVMAMVDNDYINYCTTVEPENKDYETILEAYNNGDYDISGLDLIETSANHIEAYDEYNEMFLVTY